MSENFPTISWKLVIDDSELRSLFRDERHREITELLRQIVCQNGKIMSQIQTFSDQVNAAFDKMSTAVDGVSTDVDGLKAEIAKLQTTPGAITPEDQALLDSIQNRANALAAKVDALDSMTVAPPTP